MLEMRAWVAILALGGCASSAPVRPAARATCTLAEPSWPNAENDYNRGATIDLLTAIETVIRDAPASDVATVANRLEALYKRPVGSAFVSAWAHELAMRLRQLVCAQQTGQISTDVANHRYIKLISDLEDERAVIVDEMRRGKR
jgi:hypothetical protein